MNLRKPIFVSLCGLLSITFNACKQEVEGCTDPDASNYYSQAEKDDGSCFYQNYSVDTNRIISVSYSYTEGGGEYKDGLQVKFYNQCQALYLVTALDRSVTLGEIPVSENKIAEFRHPISGFIEWTIGFRFEYLGTTQDFEQIEPGCSGRAQYGKTISSLKRGDLLEFTIGE